MAAAMNACDHWRDSPTAREHMRQDILATPHHQHIDLLDYFRQTYGAAQ